MPPLTSLILLSLLPLTYSLNYTNPLVSLDFPDPGCHLSPKDKLYYCAHTCNGEGALCVNDEGNFPVYTSADLTEWKYLGVALPENQGGRWSKDRYWAPEIHSNPFQDGNVLLYTAGSIEGQLCIGVAYAGTPGGPYKPDDEPLLCNDDEEHPNVGLIDATMYTDDSGSYLVYKVDGNADGSVSAIKYVPLVPDGGAKMAVESTSISGHNEMIASDLEWEGGCVEGPWLWKDDKGGLFMLYSGSMYNTPTYSVGVAKSEGGGVDGPWLKHGDPILHAGDSSSGFSGPGHCSVLTRPEDNRSFMVYHAHVGYSEPTIDTMRVLMMDEMLFSDDEGWPVMKNAAGVPTESVQEI